MMTGQHFLQWYTCQFYHLNFEIIVKTESKCTQTFYTSFENKPRNKSLQFSKKTKKERKNVFNPSFF